MYTYIYICIDIHTFIIQYLDAQGKDFSTQDRRVVDSVPLAGLGTGFDVVGCFHNLGVLFVGFFMMPYYWGGFTYGPVIFGSSHTADDVAPAWP